MFRMWLKTNGKRTFPSLWLFCSKEDKLRATQEAPRTPFEWQYCKILQVAISKHNQSSQCLIYGSWTVLDVDLGSYITTLYKQLKKKGAIIVKPKPMNKIINHMLNGQTKKFFNRCHSKVTLIDNDLFVGSINISDEYSDIKYGSKKFLDLNLYVKNTICKNKVLIFFKEFIIDNHKKTIWNRRKS